MRSTPSKSRCIGIASRLSKLMASCTLATNPTVVPLEFSIGITTSSPSSAHLQCRSWAMSSVAFSTPNPQLNNRNCMDLTCCCLCTISSIRNCTHEFFCAGRPTSMILQPRLCGRPLKNTKHASRIVHLVWPTDTIHGLVYHGVQFMFYKSSRTNHVLRIMFYTSETHQKRWWMCEE